VCQKLKIIIKEGEDQYDVDTNNPSWQRIISSYDGYTTIKSKVITNKFDLNTLREGYNYFFFFFF